ncbi:unnamed protein product [Cylicocyclus nassatus]|uniref:Protein HtrL n=1 Tax=Cylicocyclus nassatus TaxID=53992 RepID=A0AA36GGH7_CYLNA|nr:unnamed protein product [Cylicocyclus nassatus]
MRHLNVALIVGIALIFLILNIYGFIEILRFLRNTQHPKHILVEEELSEHQDALAASPSPKPISTTGASIPKRVHSRTRARIVPSRITLPSRQPTRAPLSRKLWPVPTRTPLTRPTPSRITLSRTTTSTPTLPPETTAQDSTSGRTTNGIEQTSVQWYRPQTHERPRVPHHHRHHHINVHKLHPHIIQTTTPTTTTSSTAPSTTKSTTTTRIHVTTNRIHVPVPTTVRPRIEIQRPPATTTARYDKIITYKTSGSSPPRVFNTHRPPHTRPPTTTTPPAEGDDFTIVTALMDIGRGDWDRYRRPLEQYHIFMENLLSLQNNMVIFTDTSSYDFIHKYRKNMGQMHRTKIHKITLQDLPLARHLDAANRIIEGERRDERLWRSIWDPAMRDHPEARSGEYNVLVNSKTYFLYNTTLEDPFSTEFFVWIDAGYGHGNQSVFPYDNKWKPHFPRNKISLIKLTPVHDPVTGYTIDSLYRRNWSVISGGFVAGDKRSIGQLHTLVHRKFIELTYRNKVDDDQTILVLVINQHPHLFSITHGDWFDAFRLFGQKSNY